MARLLFDRRARLMCAGLWACRLVRRGRAPAAAARRVDARRQRSRRSFLLFATMAFAAVGFSRRPGQLAWLALVTIALGAALEYAQGFVSYRSSGDRGCRGQCHGRAGRLRRGPARAVPGDPAGRTAAGAPRQLEASEWTRAPTAIVVRIKLLQSFEIEQFSPDERKTSRAAADPPLGNRSRCSGSSAACARAGRRRRCARGSGAPPDGHRRRCWRERGSRSRRRPSTRAVSPTARKKPAIWSAGAWAVKSSIET